MRTLTITSILMLFSIIDLQAQVGVGTTAPDPSAVLDVSGTSAGLLAPRMTQAERNAIPNPATGLIVYQTDNTPGLYWNSGTPGTPSWGLVGNVAWNLTGNAGTLDGTHFIGTTDNIPLNFRVNSQTAGRLDASGRVFLGYQAGDMSTGGRNTGIGFNSVRNSINTSTDNTGVGYLALQNPTGNGKNTAVGASALPSLSMSGEYCVAMGYNALFSNSLGSYNTGIGSNTMLSNMQGNSNTAVGADALSGVMNGSFNTAVGRMALSGFNIGNNNVGVGYQTGFSLGFSSANNVFLGYRAGYSETGSNKLYIANSETNPPLIYGDFSLGRLGLGTTSPKQKLTVNGSARISDSLYLDKKLAGTSDSVLIREGNVLKYKILSAGGGGWSLTGNAGTVDGTHFLGTTDDIPFTIRVNNQKSGRIQRSNETTYFGYQAGLANGPTGTGNTGFGYQALTAATTGGANIAVGDRTLQANQTGVGNTAVGHYALNAATRSNNTAVGLTSLAVTSTGQGNTAVGSNSGYSNLTGIANVFLGATSGYLSATGHSNTYVGTSSGYNSTGGSNVFIGYEAGYNELGSAKLYIANSRTNPPLIHGDFSLGRVSIMKINPNFTLDVNGDINFSGNLYQNGIPYPVAYTRYVGEPYGGGVIFYVDHTGQHGLICSMADLSPAHPWSNVTGTLIGSGAQSDWNGQGNSTAIMAQGGHTNSSALLCDNYTNSDYGTGVYSDWYLPSIDQLNKLFQARMEVSEVLDNDGNAGTVTLAKTNYWSSTEYSASTAFGFSMTRGDAIETPGKGTTFSVRAIREF